MADRKEPIKATSYKGGSDKKYFPHLKPLSVYSRMVYCKAFGSCSGNRSLSPDKPSWTLKVEFDNSRASVGRKRRLDDSCLDDTYDTPPKKPCLDKRSSPDSASVLECSLGTQTGSDEGYFTKSFFTPEPGGKKDTTEGEEELNFTRSYKRTIPIASTPLHKSREFVRRTPLSPKLNLEKESWSSPAIIRQPAKDSSAISLSAYVNLAADYTEASTTIPFLSVNEGKESNIPRLGTTAIHKSLVCRDQEKHTTAIQVREDVRSVSQQQAASDIQVMFREEMDSEDSFNDSLPLQVQQPEAVKAPAHQQPEKKAASDGRRNGFRDVPRPVVLYREEDWEKRKEVYVDSVTRHITDNVKDGVMTELFHLMNTVANQDRGGDGRKWQHPSDLTRRNYRLRNTGRLLSLDEWQILNFRNHRRFVKVPRVFRRSSVR
ncbi:S100P-binding protein isoform X2 [Tachysurus fulvidraco]|uniref:S100P-binding protein isoform X2 n=1 Tax=Tachysurus fulvidraco TaxID=1234273 RepID=UPI001FF06EA8|nr:S100P-binding protein isoform X2 [Tachysurus fulvidraco]